MPQPRPTHRVFLEDLADQAADDIAIRGDEAFHAVRVKRLRLEEAVTLFDGRGSVQSAVVAGASGTKSEPVLQLRLAGRRQHLEPLRPRVDVFAAVPKGDRLELMIDQLSQLGVATWRPLLCERGSEGPSTAKLARLQRVTVESAKQCGRAYLLEIGGPVTFHAAASMDRVVIADASGKPYDAAVQDPTRLVVGPEGGLTKAEIDLAHTSGCLVARFGPHIMRIETAALAAAGHMLVRTVR